METLVCSLGEGCEDIKKPRAALWKMVRQNPLCIDFRMSGKLGLTKCIVWMSKKTTQLQPRSLLRLWRKKGRKKLGNITFRLTEIWQIWREMFRLRVQTLDSPSPWQEVDFDKWVRVAIVVPRGQVSGLQHVDDQVSQLLVIVDLKLQERRKEKSEWKGISDWMRQRLRDREENVRIRTLEMIIMQYLYLSRDGVRLGLCSICSL